MADALSRAPLRDDTPEIPQEELEVYIHTLHTQGLISTKRKDLIMKETAKDEELQTLLQYVQEWPKQYKDVDHKVRPYYHCREEFTYQKGIIMKGVRTVIPQTTRRNA